MWALLTHRNAFVVVISAFKPDPLRVTAPSRAQNNGIWCPIKTELTVCAAKIWQSCTLSPARLASSSRPIIVKSEVRWMWDCPRPPWWFRPGVACPVRGSRVRERCSGSLWRATPAPRRQKPQRSLDLGGFDWTLGGPTLSRRNRPCAGIQNRFCIDYVRKIRIWILIR